MTKWFVLYQRIKDESFFLFLRRITIESEFVRFE